MNSRFARLAWTALLAGLAIAPAGAWEASVQFSGGPGRGFEVDGVFGCTDVEDTGTFYHALRPYGTWMDLPEHGWAWQPTVGATVQGWRPYCHDGRWQWTEYGWYWSSDYPWGWAAFHYGRWLLSGRHGWVWVPDVAWAPAWVVWRSSDAYYGWAPLPPGYSYRRGAGYYYRDQIVPAQHHYGLHHDHYVFVPHRGVLDRDIHRLAVFGPQCRGIYTGTAVVGYRHGHQEAWPYSGIAREEIARATGRSIEVAPVTLRRSSMTLREAAGGAPFGTYTRAEYRQAEPMPLNRIEPQPVRHTVTQPPYEAVPTRSIAPSESGRYRASSLRDMKRVQELPPQQTVVPQAQRVVPAQQGEAEVPPAYQEGGSSQTLRDLKNRR